MAKPFVKWAGGKSQLINIIDEKIGDLRQNLKDFIYVEPFVGGGSVLFHLLETCSNMKYAVINDANEQLMNVYKVIADDKKYIEFKDHLYQIQTDYNNDLMKKEKYILYRYQYNHWIKGELALSDAWGAAAFIFLNKCRELDADTEKYKSLLNECLDCIKPEYLDGSLMNNFIFSRIADDLGFKYEKVDKGVESIFSRFGKSFVQTDKYNAFLASRGK